MAWENELPADATRGSCKPVADRWLEHLSRAHGPALYRFLLRATFGDRQTAGDLTRETFLRAWRVLQPLGPDVEDLGPWLITLARRVAIDHRRTMGTRPAGAAVEDPTGVAAGGPATDILLDNQTVQLALGQLEPEQRRVVVETWGHGRSVAEVAGLLGIPGSTVKSRAYDALRALRTTIDEAASGRTVGHEGRSTNVSHAG